MATPFGFSTFGELYYQVQHFEEKKNTHIETCVIMKLPHTKITGGINMSYKHFTIEERCCLREYYKKGYSYRKIAELLGRNVSSVSRELRRNCTNTTIWLRKNLKVKLPTATLTVTLLWNFLTITNKARRSI